MGYDLIMVDSDYHIRGQKTNYEMRGISKPNLLRQKRTRKMIPNVNHLEEIIDGYKF